MALLTLLLACASAPDVRTAPPAVPGATRSPLPASLRGLSGLAAADDGRLWSVTERPAALVPLRLDGDRVVADGEPVRVRGWPVGVDAESVAWLGPGRFAVGGEPHMEGRARDVVREVSLDGGVATVGREWALDYGPFGVTADGNRGLEALDAADGVMVAGSEVVVGEERAALLWRVEGDRVAYGVVRLTSDEGKLSTLVIDGARVLAIERHYGTVRLVEAELAWGPASAPGSSEARVVRDLAVEMSGLPNIEGLSLLGDGRLVLLSDNQGGGLPRAATEALVLAPSAAPVQAQAAPR